MEKVLDAFFALLRAGLLHKPVALRGEIPWQEVYTLATQQSMLGIVFDGVSLLPEGQQPPKALLIKWMGIVAHLEQKNELLNQRAVDLAKLYASVDIPMLLMKGQGVALNYPNPKHRACGDIDVFLGEEFYKKANSLLLNDGGVIYPGLNYKHSTFTWRDVCIENHRVMLSFGHKRRNREYQKRILAWFPEQSASVVINGMAIGVAPVSFNAVYLLHHAMFHLYIDGLGLRQPMDWLLFLKQHRAEIDSLQLDRDLHRYDLFRFAQAVVYIGVTYLGFSPEELPVSMPGTSKWGELLLNEILLSGNFGHHDARKSVRPKGFLRSKWYTFYQSQRRIFRLHRLAPRESWGITKYALRGKVYDFLHPNRMEDI